MRLKGLVCLAALTVTACSDPKEANKSNFTTAINNWIEKNPHCISIPRGRITPDYAVAAPFPRYMDASPVTAKYAITSPERETAPFAPLVTRPGGGEGTRV